MKKSEIYKYALAATMKELLSDVACGNADLTEIHEVVGALCNKIDIELLNETREAGERA